MSVTPPKLEAALRIAALGIGGVYPAWLKNDYTSDPHKSTSRIYAPHKTRKHATNDAGQIRQLWADKPTDNPKVIIGPGHVVIDIDTTQGGHQDGTSNITELGEMPPTYTETTPSGGKHLVYKLPAGAAFTHTLAPFAGIEFLGEGATFIASGSTTQKGRYTDNGLSIVIAPPQIVSLIEQHKPKPRKRRELPTLPTATGDKARDWAIEQLDKKVSELRATPSGGRNRAAYAAGYWIGRVIHLIPMHETQAGDVLAAAIADWKDARHDERTIRKAIETGAAAPIEYSAIDIEAIREENRHKIAQARAAIEGEQWHGHIVIDGDKVQATTVYKVLSFALDLAAKHGNTEVFLSGRQIAIGTRCNKSRANLIVSWLCDNGYLKLTQHGNYKEGKANKYELHMQNGDRYISFNLPVPVLYMSDVVAPTCARRVTITKKRERFVGEGVRRRYANGPTLDDVPLDAIQPKPNWTGADALRAEPERERVTFDGLSDGARHVFDILSHGPRTKAEIREMTGRNHSAINRIVDRMSDEGILIKGDDRRGIPCKLADDVGDRLVLFYETGNIREHQARIRERCERDSANYRAYIEKRQPQQRPANDIAQTIAEATHELSTPTATPEPLPVQAVDTTPEPQQPAPTDVNIAHDSTDTSNAFAKWYMHQALIRLMNGPIAIRHEVLAREFGLTPTAAAAWLMTEHGVLSANMGDYLHMRRAKHQHV